MNQLTCIGFEPISQQALLNRTYQKGSVNLCRWAGTLISLQFSLGEMLLTYFTRLFSAVSIGNTKRSNERQRGRSIR